MALSRSNHGHRVGYGYVLARPFWDRGSMSEALAALVSLALAQPRIFRTAAFRDVANARRQYA